MNEDYDYSYSQDRELSWLKFNQRVLDLAHHNEVPLLEKCKFVAIFSSNLDEFFRVRVGSINDMLEMSPQHQDVRSHLTPHQQLAKIHETARTLCAYKDQTVQSLEKELAYYDITHERIQDLNKQDRTFINDYFKHQISPILSPMVMNKVHPFPHLENGSLYIVASLKEELEDYFGLVQLPSACRRLILLPGNTVRYVLAEEVLLYFVDKIFKNYIVKNSGIISVTRSADLIIDEELEDYYEDYRQMMKQLLKKRRGLHAVRLESQGPLDDKVKKYLLKHIDLSEECYYMSQSPINMKYLFDLLKAVPEKSKMTLSYPPFSPYPAQDFDMEASITRQVLKEDKLLSFPYESMTPFIRLLKECANDKETISIKITIYRLAKEAKIVKYLCEAAENGKDVVVLMELRARFDEENNILFSKVLEEAGCQILYGFEDYKVHSKICLITRKTHKGIVYITQIGTGNYNESTSRLYTDLSLMTHHQGIGEDAVRFFKNMAISNLDGDYQHLLVAPNSLKSSLINKIKEEAEKGSSGNIFMKMNSLTDRQIIDALAAASQAGTPIYLLIRGICCLVPGVHGKTENITVKSIVGQFLEHSRIYAFGKGHDAQVYISSADMMTRNTTKRVEIAVPIYDQRIKKRILDMVDIMCQDNINGKLLVGQEYISIKDQGEPMNSHQYFIEQAQKNSLTPKQGSWLQRWLKKLKA